VARDADTDEGDIAGARQLEGLRHEVAELRRALDGLTSRLGERVADRPSDR
jgi:hypothetical protein